MTRTFVYQTMVEYERDQQKNCCKCGCADCTGETCGLDCIVRPNFAAGQMLTVETMDSLIAYMRARLALERYRDGWGVVCGLQVVRDPANPGAIWVQPGYALDCCGRDVIICQPEWKDLVRDFCPSDPCNTPSVTKSSSSDGRALEFAGQVFRGVQVADLYLRFREHGEAPKVSFSTIARRDSQCDYTRTRETFELQLECLPNPTDPRRERAEKWADKLRDCLKELVRYGITPADPIRGDGSSADGVTLKNDWLSNHPAREFGFLSELSPSQLTTPEGLGWLTLDYVLACLASGCGTCDSDGIPLARVWVQANGTNDVRVLAIDDQPPYRRELMNDVWRAPLGAFNLGQVMWRHVEEAISILRDRGITKLEFRTVQISSLPRLWTPSSADSLFVEAGQGATLVIANLPTFGWRVVAVQTGKNSEKRDTEYTKEPRQEEPPLVVAPNMASAFGEERARLLAGAGVHTFAEMAKLSRKDLRRHLKLSDFTPNDEMQALLDRAAELSRERS